MPVWPNMLAVLSFLLLPSLCGVSNGTQAGCCDRCIKRESMVEGNGGREGLQCRASYWMVKGGGKGPLNMVYA